MKSAASGRLLGDGCFIGIVSGTLLEYLLGGGAGVPMTEVPDQLHR